MGLRTQSKEVQVDAATRAKLQETHHCDIFMNVLHNRRYVWEKGEGSSLANEARVETRSQSRSPQLAKKTPRQTNTSVNGWQKNSREKYFSVMLWKE